MTYCGCGPGSYFGNVLVPVPVPVPDVDLFSFSTTKYLAFSILEEALIPESWPPITDFFYFSVTFYVGSGTGTGMRYGSGSTKAKSCGSCGSSSSSGSTTLKK
jgi:hypothetical protein